MVGDHERRKVLVVEDNPDIGLWLKLDLTAHGCDVTLVPSSQEALSYPVEQWDAVSCDRMLEGSDMDGATLASTFKQMRPDLPVCVVTAAIPLPVIPGVPVVAKPTSIPSIFNAWGWDA